ncbi:uncharacterized protein LOC105258530 isoform X2 [Camponotus floridanus]|uniref:uncharacterized protein LOC105258530 isoform X2 n=1 Tax=Camponotus floridanus TaxID=104421 RepID=UPI000DC6AE9A|nr:uncharacterized protein LOC105258530 isoform X2 [Camponotus floridanus]
MMMQLRIFLYIFLLMFFVGIVLGKGEYGKYAFEEILKRESRDISEKNSNYVAFPELAPFVKDWEICKVANYLNDTFCQHFQVKEYLDSKN